LRLSYAILVTDEGRPGTRRSPWGHAVAGLNAYSKGVSLGLFDHAPEAARQRWSRRRRAVPRGQLWRGSPGRAGGDDAPRPLASGQGPRDPRIRTLREVPTRHPGVRTC